jgi:GT2 family glycosyltransferase
MTRVDVIIPCYRYAHFLPKCVASIQAQQGIDYRILVIDDCSPDNTAEVAAALAREDDRISWRRHAVNRGHIATYNEGLEWISSDYALLLSADDWVLPGAFARATALLDAHPEVGFVYGRAVNVHENQPRVAELTAPPEPGSTIFSGPAYIQLNSVRNPVATCTAMVRTAMQKRIGFYRPDLPHSADMEMWMRFAAHGAVGYLNACQGAYRQHMMAMSLGYYRRMLLDLEQRKAAIDVLFADHGGQLEQSAELRRHLYRGVAKAALDAADKTLIMGDWEQFRQLRNFAKSVDPKIRWTQPWLVRSLEQRMGPVAWELTRSTAHKLGVGRSVAKNCAA